MQMFRALISATFLAAASTWALSQDSLAAPDEIVASPAPIPPAPERTVIDACIAVARPDTQDLDLPASIAERLKKPGNRVEGQDWSKQDLTGKNLRGKVLANVKMKAAILRGADLSDAIICGGDFTEADLTGAHLDGALIGGGTELDRANFTETSARGIIIADASGLIRIDRADWRGANIVCDDMPRCIGVSTEFSSMTGADLRGATVENLCCALPGLGSAKLDGATTVLQRSFEKDFPELAAGAGESGRITMLPAYGQAGVRTEFTGPELRELAAIIAQMAPASAYPSFDCARASSQVEKAVCADPKLAALDNALDWLWKRVEHTAEEVARQKRWTGSRGNCPPPNLSSEPLSPGVSPADPKGCIGIAYAERIRELGPKSRFDAVGSGTYTTDPPLELTKDQSKALARKFLMARGYREDEIITENLGSGSGKIAGDGLWANGHECGFEASEKQAQRTGTKFQIYDDATDRQEKFSVGFVVTPQVIIRTGGDKQFQCGARGGWSDVYFRQPEDLVSSAKKLAGIK